MSVFRGFGHLAPLEEHKDGLGMFLVADVQSVFLAWRAWRKDRIARLTMKFFSLPILTEGHLDILWQLHFFLKM